MTRPKSSMTDVRQRIRDAGLRGTTARIAVMQQLEAAATPLSHADIAAELEPSGLDRATVYRNLMDLTEAGLVGRTELGDHVWRFELRREGQAHAIEHPHFMCVDCGTLTCLPDVNIAISPTPGTKRSAIGELTEILLKGRCGNCV